MTVPGRALLVEKRRLDGYIEPMARLNTEI
jgi:hypothetical protein